MMRSKIKDSQYFENLIVRQRSLIQRSYDRLANNTVVPQQLKAYKGNIFSNHLHLSIALYSSGASFEVIKDEFEKALKLMTTVWPDDGSQSEPDFLFDWYVKLLWVICFGLALDISNEEFTMIASIWDKTGRKDWLIEYLLSSRIDDRKVSETLIFEKPFFALKRAVDEKDRPIAEDLIKTYLDKDWYKGHRNVYWYEYHLNKHDIFFGYWSFEAAAVVKTAGIDDSSFRENQYYPKDLLE